MGEMLMLGSTVLAILTVVTVITWIVFPFLVVNRLNKIIELMKTVELEKRGSYGE